MRLRDVLLASSTILALAGGTEAMAQTAEPARSWRFEVAPYVWLPTVKGDLRYNLPAVIDGTVDVRADPGDYLSDLNGALLLAGSATYGRFSVFSDIMYLGVGSSGSRVRAVNVEGTPRNPISSQANVGGSTDVKSTFWTLGAGYTVAEGAWGFANVFGGMRWLRVEGDSDYNVTVQTFGPRGGAGPSFGGAGRLSATDNILNGIIGVRGRVNLGEGFFVPYYLDVGTGASQVTWQAFGGIGYQTGWAGVQVGYRYLSLDQGGTAFVQNMSLSGAYLAVNFSF